MTDDRSLERVARSWIEVGPTTAPTHAVDVALLRIESTPQERDLRIPWRITVMPLPARVAAAALAGVLLVGGAVYLFAPGNRSSVGGSGPSPSAASTPSAPPSPEASRAIASDGVPPEIRGNWQALADHSIAGLYDVNESIQLTVDPNDGRHAWIETAHGGAGFRSAVHAMSAGEIKLVTPSPSNDQGVTASCTEGQVGTYRWSRSADGKSLTLTAVDDQCADRITTLARTWRLAPTS
jgi:hypothetical protein